MGKFTKEVEDGIVSLINGKYFNKAYMEDYTKIEVDVYNENIMQEILHRFKFKDIGSVFDHPMYLPQPEMMSAYDISINFDMYQRIAVSKKHNAVVFYTIERYGINCIIMLNYDKLKKFSKQLKEILEQDSRANMFREINFECAKGEYIEVSDPTGETMKIADVVKKKVTDEKLVFDDDSVITQVMVEILHFFSPETKKMYARMDIAYKLGMILHGTPGNGKSTMIREIIRSAEDMVKVVINPNISSVTKVLDALTKSLEGRPALIILEDIDSLITDRNRSSFLNILDGVDIKSGICFIGTTNYPDRIDPAFMNRAGRFDRTYEIGNPSESTRQKYFASKKIGEILSEFKVFKDENTSDTDEGVVELFTKHSDKLPMASLKELMANTQYTLVMKPDMSIEEAVELAYNTITTNREKHEESHSKYKRSLADRVRDR